MSVHLVLNRRTGFPTKLLNSVYAYEHFGGLSGIVGFLIII